MNLSNFFESTGSLKDYFEEEQTWMLGVVWAFNCHNFLFTEIYAGLTCSFTASRAQFLIGIGVEAA